MKKKLLNLGLILASLIGYTEWGTGNSTFLFTAEADVLIKMFTNASSVIHPFTVIPILGQLILLFTLFQREPGKLPTYIGLSALSLLIVFIFLIGIMSMNFKVLLSTAPFIALGIYTVMQYRGKKV